MKRVSKSQLKKLEAQGATVKRKMGTGKKVAAAPKKEVEPPKKEVKKEHASMAASMDSHAAQAEATRLVVAKNTEVMEEFRKSLDGIGKPQEPSPYTFDIKRDKEGLLKKVYARPGILEGDDEIQRH